MAYLIDGHNLIGQLPDLSLSDPDDEAQLVQKLIGFTARTSKRVVVIFDHGLPGGKSRLSTGKVEVVFASPRTNADAIMKERIKAVRDPGQWTVVSNDNEVLEAARQRRMRVLKSRDFVPMLRNTAVSQRRTARSRGDAPDVHVSSAEIDEWLKLFGGDDVPGDDGG
ncbi:MAG: NYN domain-containing protein [Anaerolineae bacterium]|nr:NYN domain-containing protein [Anaerolineae bacterium]